MFDALKLGAAWLHWDAVNGGFLGAGCWLLAGSVAGCGWSLLSQVHFVSGPILNRQNLAQGVCVCLCLASLRQSALGSPATSYRQHRLDLIFPDRISIRFDSPPTPDRFLTNDLTIVDSTPPFCPDILSLAQSKPLFSVI